MRAVDLPRVKCLLVAPFENASDAPLAAEAATGAVLSAVDPARARVFPIPELRWLFRDTPLELPEGIAPSLALELGALLGADAALYGAVEGRSRGPDGALAVTVRLSLVAERDLAFATTVEVRPGPSESLEGAVRRATLDAARPVLARLGGPGRKECFDRDRTARLRALALADATRGAGLGPGRGSLARAEHGAAQPAASAAPAPAAASAPTPTPTPAAAPAAAAARPTAPKAPARAAAPPRRVAARPALTPRQAEWARKLAGNQRLLVEDVAFEGRSADLDRDAGLGDLAAALAEAPGLRIRIEGFVDATSDPGGDARLSMAMAQAAAARLAELGVARDRLTTAGRGGDSPLLPNFTARGRAANRRIEVVAVR